MLAGMKMHPVALENRLLEYEAGSMAAWSVASSAVGLGVATGNDRERYLVAAGTKVNRSDPAITIQAYLSLPGAEGVEFARYERRDIDVDTGCISLPSLTCPSLQGPPAHSDRA